MSRKLSLVILVLGLIFSSILRVKFNLNGGFQFHGVWFKLIPIPFFDYSGSIDQKYLTTTFIGYFFYLILILGYFKHFVKQNSTVKVLVILSFALTCCALFVEMRSILNDALSLNNGMHFRVGPLLCLLGVLIYERTGHTKQVAK